MMNHIKKVFRAWIMFIAGPVAPRFDYMSMGNPWEKVGSYIQGAMDTVKDSEEYKEAKYDALRNDYEQKKQKTEDLEHTWRKHTVTNWP